MRTLADVKRRAQLGVALELIYHRYQPAGHAPIPRVVTHVQTNAITMTPWPGKARDSWLWWPAASCVRIEDPDTFSILDEQGVEMTYRFV